MYVFPSVAEQAPDDHAVQVRHDGSAEGGRQGNTLVPVLAGRPEAWPRDELQKLPQRRAMEYLERLRKGVASLRDDVNRASAFLKAHHGTDASGAVALLQQWVDAFAVRSLVLAPARGEVARFVRYNDALLDECGEPRMSDHDLAMALLRSGWFPDTETPVEKLTIRRDREARQEGRAGSSQEG